MISYLQWVTKAFLSSKAFNPLLQYSWLVFIYLQITGHEYGILIYAFFLKNRQHLYICRISIQ